MGQRSLLVNQVMVEGPSLASMWTWLASLMLVMGLADGLDLDCGQSSNEFIVDQAEGFLNVTTLCSDSIIAVRIKNQESAEIQRFLTVSGSGRRLYHYSMVEKGMDAFVYTPGGDLHLEWSELIAPTTSTTAPSGQCDSVCRGVRGSVALAHTCCSSSYCSCPSPRSCPPGRAFCPTQGLCVPQEECRTSCCSRNDDPKDGVKVTVTCLERTIVENPFGYNATNQTDMIGPHTTYSYSIPANTVRWATTTNTHPPLRRVKVDLDLPNPVAGDMPSSSPRVCCDQPRRRNLHGQQSADGLGHPQP